VAGRIERDLTAEKLREQLSNELRRYMAPVAMPTVVPQESEANQESPLRARVPTSVEGVDAEEERPL
jgi:hypothetical protein